MFKPFIIIIKIIIIIIIIIMKKTNKQKSNVSGRLTWLPLKCKTGRQVFLPQNLFFKGILSLACEQAHLGSREALWRACWQAKDDQQNWLHSNRCLYRRESAINLIHDARHPWTLLRTDGIKAMSRGFSWGKQGIIFSNTRNRRRVGLFLTTENEQLPIF